MIWSSDRHRPRRFFGWQGVVRALRRSRVVDAGGWCSTAGWVTPPPGPPDLSLPAASTGRRQTPAEADRALQPEHARFAAKLDAELRLACRSEAAMRRELGKAARAFVHCRAYHRLGFVRLSDYARERLGVSARTLQTAAWLATRLDALPAVSRAYDRSELSWAQARAICKVAVAADEDRWLALARGSTVASLERLVAGARRPEGVPADPEDEPDEVDGEPAVHWRFACPARVRALWRRACELASRVAGEPLAPWRAAEVIAAEGSSGRPASVSLSDRASIEAGRRAPCALHEARHEAGAVMPPARTSGCEPPPRPPDCSPPAASPRLSSPALKSSTDPAASPELTSPTLRPSTAAATSSDPFALDARLAEAVRVLRTIEPRIGRLLRVAVDRRIHQSFGHPVLADYVRERLGMSARKAWALLKIEKATARNGDLDRAYHGGSLSWVRVLALLPVLDQQYAAAWIARAKRVTVRRLNDEVEWVLTRRDLLGPTASLAPPPLDSRLPSPFRDASPSQCRDSSPAAGVQIGAHGAEPTAAASECQFSSPPPPTLEVADAEIRFTGPASVVALLRDVLDAFANPGKPRWAALERLLRHVITHWESAPRHPDPVFVRDGWRCTVPACSSRRNLHDHHLRFRSRGGGNARDNRTTVCAAHHLHGIHDGTIDASGTAPHAIEWRLGVRPGAPPFLEFVGDRYR